MDASRVAMVDYFLPHDGGDVPIQTVTSFHYSLHRNEQGYPIVHSASDVQELLDIAAKCDGTYILYDAATDSVKDIYVIGRNKKIAHQWKIRPKTMVLDCVHRPFDGTFIIA